MDLSIFKKLGLNDKEIKVYLTLLEYGAISVRSLAELADLNRGSAYDILKSLQEKGLVSYFHQDTKQKFVAENPSSLVKLVENKEQELLKIKDNFSDLIPELKALQDKGENLPTTKFYEGTKGIREILDDLLITMSEQESREYFVYSATEASDDLNQAFPDFTKQRIKKGIQVKAISLAEGGATHGLDERRWLGTKNQSATFILIYNNKCAFISRDAKGNPVGVIIENKMICETQKIIFLRLWDLLK
ncbi:MAG: TrmB family transcriptional regulator [Candidatus Parcubacteria bacterium]|nr:TrmB family transcriptional regulator [Candidatus Parcubacteria bacterium]